MSHKVNLSSGNQGPKCDFVFVRIWLNILTQWYVATFGLSACLRVRYFSWRIESFGFVWCVSTNVSYSWVVRCILTCLRLHVTFRQLSAFLVRWRAVITHDICVMNIYFSRSGWPCGLKRKFAADWLLGWRIRTLRRAWIYVSWVGYVLCRERPLRRADRLVRGVLSVVCVSNGVRDLETSRMKWPRPDLGSNGT
jgi:hypothetical protein